LGVLGSGDQESIGEAGYVAGFDEAGSGLTQLLYSERLPAACQCTNSSGVAIRHAAW